MALTRMVLKIVALSLAAAAVVCVTVAYWDNLLEFASSGKTKFRSRMAVSEYDDFEE